jgi:hypothetical protein
MLLAGAALLTACGGAAAQSPPAATGNVRVCDHYRTQRAFVLNDAKPDLALAMKVAVWVSADQAQAQPGTALARDLRRWLTAAEGHGGTTTAVARLIRSDCAALGVTFTR